MDPDLDFFFPLSEMLNIFVWKPVLWSRSILARLRLQLVKMAAPALAL